VNLDANIILCFRVVKMERIIRQKSLKIPLDDFWKIKHSIYFYVFNKVILLLFHS